MPLISVNVLTHLIELCARNHCAMAHGCFIPAVKQGRESLLSTAAASPAASWSNSLKIQAVKVKCWIQLVWGAVGWVPQSPRNRSVFSCEGNPGSSTGTGAQTDDGKQNLRRGKGARSFVDISAKSVPGLISANFLPFICASHFK